VSEGNTRSTFFVQLSVTTDPIAEPQNGSVVNVIRPALFERHLLVDLGD
jgi:hypothetical protein